MCGVWNRLSGAAVHSWQKARVVVWVLVFLALLVSLIVSHGAAYLLGSRSKEAALILESNQQLRELHDADQEIRQYIYRHCRTNPYRCMYQDAPF